MNVEHPTSNDEIASLRQFKNWQNTLFKIRRSMFDVRVYLLICLSICGIFSLKSLKQRLIHCSFIACQLSNNHVIQIEKCKVSF
jgi:hypothetical protein